MRTPNTCPCPCPLTRGVCLWEVKNAVFERRNRLDHSLCPLMGGVRLREVSISGGSTVVQLLIFFQMLIVIKNVCILNQ